MRDALWDRRLTRRILFIAALLSVTICIGTVGFSLMEGWSIFDAFYMTLITITTVGYQEVHPLNHAGRVFNCFVILFGVSVMFIALGAVAQTMVELELEDRYGRRRRKRVISELRDHFIVCGYGRVGRNASDEFYRANVPFLVVDKNEQRVARAVDAGMLAILADATNDDDLRDAGVMHARGLIAALPSDAENLFIILSAKNLNPALAVVTRASEEQNEEKLRRAGADTVFAPYTLAGRRLANSLLRPHVAEFLDFATAMVGPQIAMEEIQVGPESEFVSKQLGSVISRHDFNVITLAVRRAGGQILFNPPSDCEILAGDYLILLGEKPGLKKLEQRLTGK